MFYKNHIEKFSKVNWKAPVLQPLSHKVAYCMSATLLKQRLQYMRFPTNYAKFLKTPFLIEHLDEYLVIAIALEQPTRTFPVQTAVLYQ